MPLRLNLITYTSDGVYDTPTAGAYKIEISARGAGGGGTSGVNHSTVALRKAGAGGGGGAVTPPSPLMRVGNLMLPLTIVVGSGGAGGPGAPGDWAWNPGQDGQRSIVTDAAGAVLAVANGGGGAPDWPAGGAAGANGAHLFNGGIGGGNGAEGGWALAFPVQLVSGGGGGGGGGGYDAAGNLIPDNGINGRGGRSGLIYGPGRGGNGYQPTFWEWCQSGTGGGGGTYPGGLGGAGGFPAGGGGGGGGWGGWGGSGADGLVTIIEYILEE